MLHEALSGRRLTKLEYELQLAEHQVVVAKFWMSVSPAEQLARFQERNRNPLKRFKVDREDWRNRKRHARLAVLQGLCERVETALG